MKRTLCDRMRLVLWFWGHREIEKPGHPPKWSLRWWLVSWKDSKILGN